ncbi:glycosyltransferase [Stakelama sp. CBK3Z-3]|uniref:Glycosyltransferase n=1 Tax=Stakelama flava TaxID=2860338 RepID=A0ABS6XPW0_9SPHN|nr:glycosyltransferase [Stakelama flava]MBW4332216.1 glycosyltransferase [Stakelama flava]
MLSVLTIVRNREAHLAQLVEGLRRSARKADELVVVDMSDTPIGAPAAGFPIRIERLETDGLPLAAARNRAAAMACGDQLLFLDVDCIAMRECLGRLSETLDRHDALLCADVRYLGPDDGRGSWEESALLAAGAAHPVRCFPVTGVREEPQAGLFWSLAFAIRRARFEALGGFDEAFTGYGGEDTDFGYRARDMGLPLLFVGGAIACHQYHASHDPPIQHLDDIVANARRFHARWHDWPMRGWLDQFTEMGVVEWHEGAPVVRRQPTAAERTATLSTWPASPMRIKDPLAAT